MACREKPKTTDRFSDLWGACFTGHLKRVITRIEQGDPVNGKDKDGFMPIHRAAQGGCVDAVAVLIQNNANPRSQSTHGLTPLHVACFHRKLGVVNELLGTTAKEDLNTKDTQHGMTPLHIAINCGSPDVVDVLMQAGADPLIADNYGYCAFPSAQFWEMHESSGKRSTASKHKSTHAQLVKLKCPQPHQEYFEPGKQAVSVA